MGKLRCTPRDTPARRDLKLMVKMIKPKYLVPIHGYHFMLRTNADVAESIGMAKENIIAPLNNGIIIEADDEKNKNAQGKRTLQLRDGGLTGRGRCQGSGFARQTDALSRRDIR